MKQRLKKLVAMLGIAVLVSSQTVTALANEVAVATNAPIVMWEGEESDHTDAIKPVINVTWCEDEPGVFCVEDEREYDGIITYVYQIMYDGILINCWSGPTESRINYMGISNSINNTGAYQVFVYSFPGYLDREEVSVFLEDAEWDACSDVYYYEHPGRVLELPENITLNEDGIISWDPIENEYVRELFTRLVDVTDSENPVIVDSRFISGKKTQEDFSDVIEEGKEYAICIEITSEDVEVWGNRICGDTFGAVMENLLYFVDDDSSNQDEILPIVSAVWDEDYPGMLLIDDPNSEGVEITYVIQFFRDGEELIDSYRVGSPYTYDVINDIIYESGNYYAVIYMFPGCVEYQDAYEMLGDCEYVFTSEVLSYEHPGRSLPLADNLTLYSDGIISWDAIDSEYVECYYVGLYEVNNEGQSIDEKYNFVLDEHVYADECYGAEKIELDISSIFDPSKQYGLVFNTLSKDINEVAHQKAQNYFLSEEDIMEIEITDILLPVTNLVWEDTTLVCENPNEEDVWVFFELTRDGEMIATTDAYIEADEDFVVVECDEDITESGEYVATVYVVSGEYSYEEALEIYATEGLVSESDILVCTVTEPSEPESSEPESSEPESSEPESSEPEPSEPESSEPESSEPEPSEPESSEPESSEPESSEPEPSEPESSEPESSEPESSEPESSEPESSEPEPSEPESSEPESSEPESSEPESSVPESSEPESSEEESSEEEESSTEESSSEEESSEEESSTQESKPASKPASNATSSSKPAVKPAPKKAAETVEIIEEIIPLASSIEKAGYPYVQLLLSNNKAPLTSKQLSKYFGKDMILQAHLGNGVGFTIDAKKLSEANAPINISAELIELKTFANGFNTFHVKPFKPAKLGQEVGIHISVGQEYEGKKAYVYKMNIITGNLEFVGAWDVNASGNVGLYIDAMTDIVVMIED